MRKSLMRTVGGRAGSPPGANVPKAGVEMGEIPEENPFDTAPGVRQAKPGMAGTKSTL